MTHTLSHRLPDDAFLGEIRYQAPPEPFLPQPVHVQPRVRDVNRLRIERFLSRGDSLLLNQLPLGSPTPQTRPLRPQRYSGRSRRSPCGGWEAGRIRRDPFRLLKQKGQTGTRRENLSNSRLPLTTLRCVGSQPMERLPVAEYQSPADKIDFRSISLRTGGGVQPRCAPTSPKLLFKTPQRRRTIPPPPEYPR